MLSDPLQHVDEKMSNELYYRIFGELIETNHPLEDLPAIDLSPSTLRYSTIKENPPRFNKIDQDPIYKYSGSYNVTVGVNKPLEVYRYKNCCLVHFSELAEFYVCNKDIILQQINADNRNLVDIFFLGVVISLWLEIQNMPVLHASAVRINDKAAAFLSLCQSGKSTLAAGFMQSGYPLMTDDVLAIERSDGAFLVRPGYPQMKMWPEAASRLLGHYQDLKLVDPKDHMYTKVRVPVGPDGFGTFCSQPLPLAAIYLPTRQDEDSDIRIDPVTPVEAIIELIRYSFIGNLVENLGLQQERFSFFAKLTREVPIRRLIYPSSFDNLKRVKDAVLDDLSNIF